MQPGKCFLCGRWGWMELHHIFSGPNRKLSEKYGLTVLLCGESCHRNGAKAAHRNKDTALMLHQYGQRKYMSEQGATVEQFISVFGRNYL